MNGGEIIARTMRVYGAEHFFMLTGGDQELWIGLRDEGIDMVLSRSERSAACMADAYARITNRPAFTYAQAGPGAAILLGGLVDSHWAGSPVIAVTSSPRRRTRFKGDYQELNQEPLYDPMCKMNVEAPDGHRLVDLLRTAYRTSISGNPGPVHIDLPREVYAEDVGAVEIYAEEQFMTVPPFRPAPEATAVERTLEILRGAERPVVIAGGGVLISDAWEEFTAMVEELGIPVATTMGGKGAISEEHPLAIGVSGKYSRRSANDLVRRADAIIALGCGLGSLATADFSLLPEDAAIVHIDIDPVTLGRSYREAVSIQADAGAAIAAIRAALPAAGLTSPEAWVEEARERTAEWQAAVDAQAASGREGALAPAAVIRTVSEAMHPEDIMVADTGYMSAWAGALQVVKQAGRNFIRTGGALGWSFPATLGAQVARPERRAVTIVGDGGIGYHIGDMETAVRRELPVVVMLLNNVSLAYEYHIQKYNHDTEVAVANDFVDVDHSAVARAYGWHGERVTSPDRLAGAVADAFAQRRPALIECMVDREAIGPVTQYEATLPRQV